eukprot:scaffold203601_cov51-Attheya_sp.AAC.1
MRTIIHLLSFCSAGLEAIPDTLSTGATRATCTNETATHEPNNEDHDHDDDDDGTVVASNTSTLTDLEDCAEGLSPLENPVGLFWISRRHGRHHRGHLPDKEDNDNDDSKLEFSNKSQNQNNQANRRLYPCQTTRSTMLHTTTSLTSSSS